MIALAFGGGRDSTGVLTGWVERGLQRDTPIDVIVFADTGGEKPHTYEHIERMQVWLAREGMPPITIVRKGGIPETLEMECSRKRTLPSLAFGFKTCSQKYKQAPQDKFFNNDARSRAVWARGERVVKLIGYEFRESRRWAKAPVDDGKYVIRFPLVEWEWNAQECLESVKRAGLPAPGKSACFFCPASTKPEIDALKTEYPVLFARAIAMEDNAVSNLKSVKGIGRRFSWRDYAVTELEPDVVPCMACVDGES